MTGYPPIIDGKPVFAVNPNDCCFNLDCQTCGGRVWIDQGELDVESGQEVGIAWFAPVDGPPKVDQIMWGMRVAGCEDGAFYVEPEGGWPDG